MNPLKLASILSFCRDLGVDFILYLDLLLSYLFWPCALPCMATTIISFRQEESGTSCIWNLHINAQWSERMAGLNLEGIWRSLRTISCTEVLSPYTNTYSRSACIIQTVFATDRRWDLGSKSLLPEMPKGLTHPDDFKALGSWFIIFTAIIITNPLSLKSSNWLTYGAQVLPI